MKKLIVIVASLLIAVSAHAQLGVVAGVTSSKTDLDIENVKNATMYHVGLTYKLDLGLIAIQPSVLYNMKGARFDTLNKETTADDFEYKTGYLEIPVQLQAGLNLGLARIYGFVEPFVGYAVSNGIKYDKDIRKTWDNIRNKVEYGVGLGAGVELIQHVQVSLKYFWNMGEMYGTDVNLGKIASTVGEQKANGIAASVAILF